MTAKQIVQPTEIKSVLEELKKELSKKNPITAKVVSLMYQIYTYDINKLIEADKKSNGEITKLLDEIEQQLKEITKSTSETYAKIRNLRPDTPEYSKEMAKIVANWGESQKELEKIAKKVTGKLNAQKLAPQEVKEILTKVDNLGLAIPAGATFLIWTLLPTTRKVIVSALSGAGRAAVTVYNLIVPAAGSKLASVVLNPWIGVPLACFGTYYGAKKAVKKYTEMLEKDIRGKEYKLKLSNIQFLETQYKLTSIKLHNLVRDITFDSFIKKFEKIANKENTPEAKKAIEILNLMKKIPEEKKPDFTAAFYLAELEGGKEAYTLNYLNSICNSLKHYLEGKK
jgi:hypothetical protein